MIQLIYSAVLAAAAIFTVACVARAARFASAPWHLRWELYPVPHEAPERVAHGGSYFELSEWWRQPRRRSLVGELRVMVPEMLFLHGLRTFNRPLWFRSFPFHFGLYLLGGTLALVFGGSLLTLLAPSWAGTSALAALHTLARVTGVSGLVLAIAGAGGLLHRRLTDPALQVSTTPGDIFNLLFFVAAFSLLGVGYATRPADAPGAFTLAAGLLTWNKALAVPPSMSGGILAGALLVAYIPLTHMAHFIAKYFTYHSVRWDDQPMAGHARRAAALAEYLAFRPTWSAAHIRRGEASPTWAEIATTNPADEPKR